MARKHVHEEHANHEAWAIPYGDLVTLLLALFVVMYAISSVNEGKFRAVSDALNAEFGGPPRSISPLQLGKHQLMGSSFDRPSLATSATRIGPAPASQLMQSKAARQSLDMPRYGKATPGMVQTALDGGGGGGKGVGKGSSEGQLMALGQNIQAVLSDLVQKKLVTVRRGANYLEVEIQSDILFASGVAAPNPLAAKTIREVADVLREVPNAVRVEGYTDDQPIATAQYPSNWELSAARAASVVHVLADQGVPASRLAVVGYGEFQPIADNGTLAGRNANRRVMLVILAAPEGTPQGPDAIVAMPAAKAPVVAASADAAELAPVAAATPAIIKTAVAAPGQEATDMQIWAIANQKGGVGKTTSTLCLARALAESGQRVLLIDLDPHASMTRAFNVPRHPVPSGTHELFAAGAPALDTLARTTPIDRLRLLAAQPGLATLERRSATQPGLGMALQRALAGVGHLYDYALLDCPPTLGLLMVNALAAADCLVVPTQTDPLALHGLADMLRTAEMVETSRRRPLARFVLPTLFDKRTALGNQSLELLHGLYAGQVWPDAVPMDARLRDARAIAANAPLVGAGAQAYQQALAWLLDQPPATTPQSRAA